MACLEVDSRQDLDELYVVLDTDGFSMNALRLAGEWASQIIALQKERPASEWSGPKSGIEHRVRASLDRITDLFQPSHELIDEATLVLSRYWKHRGSFNRWLTLQIADAETAEAHLD